MNEFKITINGSPTPQGRPRFARVGSFTRTYDPNKNQKAYYKYLIADQIETIIPEPLEVDITYYLAIPESTSNKKKKLMEEGEIKHTKKPDIDNLIKMSLDCLNEIAFNDDKQIYKITAEKKYDPSPRTEVVLRWNS